MKDQLKQAVIDGNGDIVNALTQALLAGGSSAREILDEALLPGMEVVGARMREGDMFIPEVLLSARVMQGALDILKPHLGEGAAAGLGTVVIGTVEGDLHDIGKNLVGMLMQGAGFTVVNLGTGVTAADFVAAAQEHSAQIIGMSALLTTTLPRMAETIAALKDAGLRDSVKVMVGGAPVTQAYADEIGADGYGANAGMAVERAKELVG
ncbi:MAG TPA: corrinoid protein [Thermoleophilia bacterium]|nr:corrinoid protein [Acidobacteriota bacterium]NLT91883.1 cobalamin-binding protein [Actinomycetota bacterium]HOU28848.1 corrinoid protein [Thermoleophilia bacterium]HQF52924.1 corrinoid protein [Thermoleophilia bacterium]HQJ26258.1 corrinoid protein [Thermoleophilia bacterium]